MPKPGEFWAAGYKRERPIMGRLLPGCLSACYPTVGFRATIGFSSRQNGSTWWSAEWRLSGSDRNKAEAIRRARDRHRPRRIAAFPPAPPRAEQVSAGLRERRWSIPQQTCSRSISRPPLSSGWQYHEGLREDVAQDHNWHSLWVGYQRRPTIRPDRGFSYSRSPRPPHMAKYAKQANRLPLRVPRLRA